MKRILYAAAVAGLLAAFWLQMFLALPKLSATTDEVAHIPAGYTYWATRDFRLNPEHPPLAKLIAALPLVAMRPHLDLSWPEWKDAAEFPFGFGFLYTNNADRLLFWSRLMMTFVAALGGIVVFLWSREMFGAAPGLFALALYAFCPNLLAHGMLVTTDVPLAVFMTLALYLFWKNREGSSLMLSLAMGIATGAAMAAKFSGAIVPLILIAFSMWRVFGSTDKLAQFKMEARSMLIAGVAAFVVIEAAYLFSAGPWTYFDNLQSVNRNHNPNHVSYLFGRFSRTPFWTYFPLAFAVKATIPMLITTVLVIIDACVTRFVDRRGEMLLLTGIISYTGALMWGADDLGLRYMLPVFLLLLIWGSRIAARFAIKPAGIAILIVLGAWQVKAAIGAFPNYIPYFNEIAGGARGGIQYLDDSNVDWGQGLKQAAEYVRSRNLGQVELLPFSPFDSPRYYGVDRPRQDDIETYRMLISSPPHPGVYIVSAHHLIRMMYIRPEWNPAKAIDVIGGSMWVFRF